MRVDGRTDQELTQRCLAGSREAAAELFERHWPAAWRAAFAITGSHSLAEDAAQDAFQRAFGALPRFDSQRQFGPWFHRIVVNRALDLVRRERRLVEYGEADEPAVEWIDERLRDTEIFAALANLPAERRAVIVLRYWLDYTPEEISAVLELPVGTVSSRLSRGLADLRSRMEETNVG